MSTQDNGGPAFPQPLVKHPQGGFTHPSDGYGLGGATLRDYFAAKAFPFAAAQYAEHGNSRGWDEGWRDGVAKEAYALADSMLKARQQ